MKPGTKGFAIKTVRFFKNEHREWWPRLVWNRNPDGTRWWYCWLPALDEMAESYISITESASLTHDKITDLNPRLRISFDRSLTYPTNI